MSHILGCSFGTKQQHSWKSGSRNALVHTQTQRKEVCVVDGDEGRAIKKPGSRWVECPGMPHMAKAWKLVCPVGGFKLQTDFGSSVGEKNWHDWENKLKCHSSIIAFFSLHLFTHHTSAPEAQLQNKATRTVLYSYLQYTICMSLPVVCFGYRHSNVTVNQDPIVTHWILGQWIIIAHVV